MILRWPLPPEHRRVTQIFGARPDYYQQWNLAGHEGIDVSTPIGTPVSAAHDGLVQRLYSPDTYGVWLQVWGDDVMTAYAHLSAVTVTSGQRVTAGTPIGLSGMTGNCDGAHLHFGVCPLPRDVSNSYKGWVNPAPYLEDGMTNEARAAAIKARFEWEEIVRLMEDARALRAQAAECIATAERKEAQAFLRLQQGVNTKSGLAYMPEILLGGAAPPEWEI